MDAANAGATTPPGPPSPGTALTEAIEPSLKKRLVGRCSFCGYEGTMGWNRKRLTGGALALQLLSIPVTLVVVVIFFQVLLFGFLLFVPAIVLRLALQRYHAQCPHCRQWLFLKESEVSEVKNAL
jgi:hypothetical protein